MEKYEKCQYFWIEKKSSLKSWWPYFLRKKIIKKYIKMSAADADALRGIKDIISHIKLQPGKQSKRVMGHLILSSTKATDTRHINLETHRD